MSDTSSPSKSKKSDKAKTKSSSDSASSSKSSASSDAPAKGKSSKERAADGHSISYFSSISTDEYRAGWDSIFGNKKNQMSESPTTIILTPADLDEKLLAGLRQAFRAKAMDLGLNIDRLEANSTLDWQLACTYTPRQSS